MNIKEITDRLEELSTISSQLEITTNERLTMINEVGNYADHFVDRLADMKCFTNRESGDVSISEGKKSLENILNQYENEVVNTGIVAPSGRHFGYIPAGGIYASAIADYLAAVTNPYAGVHYANPGAANIEMAVIDWLKSVFSFPASAVGTLTSGGSVSNLIAFAAARDKYGIKNEKIGRSVVYLTDQAHHSAQKALRIVGLEDVILKYVSTDDNFRMRADLLEHRIEEDLARGLNPFLIIATAGTTDTGAVDPLDRIGDVAGKFHLWFHVDAAYGGFFILTSKKYLFKGIEKADSLIVDPHKSLFIPYGLAAVLIKDKNSVFHSNAYSGNYMQDTEGDEMTKSPANLSPELTRHFRGLRLWLPLQLHGLEPFRACLEEKLWLTKYFRIKLSDLGFRLGPEPDLSVTYFWYPFKEDTNEKNKQLMDEIHRDGSYFFSSTVINNQFVIRIAVLSFRSKKEMADGAVDMIQRCMKRVI